MAMSMLGMARRACAAALVAVGLACGFGCVHVHVCEHHALNGARGAQALAGTWVVSYGNGARRTYDVTADGTVRLREEGRTGQLQHGDDLVLRFDDGKVERWTPARGRLLVEHWDPASRFPAQPPTVLGVGVRTSHPGAGASTGSGARSAPPPAPPRPPSERRRALVQIEHAPQRRDGPAAPVVAASGRRCAPSREGAALRQGASRLGVPPQAHVPPPRASIHL